MQMETPNNILKHLKVNPKPEVNESYFNDFSNKLLNEINQEKSTLRISYRKTIFWISSAAAVALLVLTFKFIQKPEEINLSQLSKSEIHQYLVQHVDDIEDESLMSKQTTSTETSSQISKEEI